MKYLIKLKFILIPSMMLIFFFGYAQHNVKTIVIDAGHGGKDPGAVGFGLKEKDITLSVALKLGKLIKDNFKDVKVIYTRTNDEFVELYKRAKIANNAKADLFISIHVNSSKKPDPFGSETYVMGLSKSEANLEVAMTENAVILKEDDYKNQYEGFDPHSPEAYIIFSLYQNAFFDLSLTFSSYLQNEYSKINRENRGVKQAGFLVLWKTAMPSVLTEIGFISNQEEANFMANENNHWLIAKAIFNAFSKYKGHIENKSYKELELKDIKQYFKDKEIIIDTTKNMLAIKDSIQPNKYQKDSMVCIDKTKTNEPLLFPQINDTIYYYVQIASSDKQIKQFKIQNVEELYIDNKYKYVCCKSKKYVEALDYQKEIKKYYPDAFIIAIKNGKKISLSEAIKETKN